MRKAKEIVAEVVALNRPESQTLGLKRVVENEFVLHNFIGRSFLNEDAFTLDVDLVDVSPHEIGVRPASLVRSNRLIRLAV